MNTRKAVQMFTESDIIYSYTRAQAIDDGQLVEINAQMLKEAGVRLPSAMTFALFETLNPKEDAKKIGQDLAGRIWDMLHLFRFSVRNAADDSEIRFKFYIQKSATRKVLQEVKAVLGPDDNGQPCITFMLPNED